MIRSPHTPAALLAVLLTSALALASPLQDDEPDPNATVDPKLLQGLKYRLAGPFRGGRVTAVAGLPDRPHTFFMGSTGGGVWKTEDGGESWKNISDGFFKVGSIGAIAAAPSDPNVLYVGTGSHCPRGNVSIGNGMYRSTDGGETWKHVGLEKAGQIGKIEIHPRDPDRLYAAVLGNVFGSNPERGVYRSRDGGASWEKVLFVSDKTGAVDLSMNPRNPRILYAGMWRVERKPWTLIDGDEEGGVYKSLDGGDTWKRLEGGLPGGVLGRVGVAVSPANPDRVWVLQEAADEKKGGLYRSDDGGDSFTRINRDHNLRQRAWYYTHVIADPVDENTVYVMNVSFLRSIDAGKSFQRVRVPHGDNHALWINPHNSEVMINGNDGGANVSYNGGKSWSSQLNQPTAEFYRVTVDNQFPYRLYGAQQDNSTISVPSRMSGGLTPKEHWFDAGGGESGHIAVDPRDPNVIYAGNYIGQITRLDRRRHHIRDVVAYPEMHDGMAGRDIKYRYQWNAPIRISPHDPDVLYHASQHVHVSRDGGQSWEVISPDLTTDNDAYQDIPGGPVQHDHTGVELYTTIFALEESPHAAGELWAGSDDGLVHLSKDAGKNWKNVTPPTMPKNGTVNTIELSRRRPGRAFLAVQKYRENDFRPYIFQTDDYGQSWKLLTDGKNGIPENHFVRAVREDPDREGLLYAGTEFGMYVSFDGGQRWQSLQLKLPITPVTDLAVHEQDLVVATQGRSFWILDDLTPLHQITQQVKESKAHLFAPRAAYRTQFRRLRGSTAPPSPPRGALVYFYFSEAPKEDVQLEILDPSGAVVRSFQYRPSAEEAEGEDAEEEDDEAEDKLEIKSGLNRFEWDLTYPAPEVIKGSRMSISSIRPGPTAPPGVYQARLVWGEWSQTQPLEVRKDPRWSTSDEDLAAQLELALKTRDLLTESHAAIRKIRSVRTQIKDVADRALKAGRAERIKKRADELAETLTELEEELIQTRNESSQDPINYPPKLDNQIAYLFSVLKFQDARPTQGCRQRFEDLRDELAIRTDRLARIIEEDVAGFVEMLREEGVAPVVVP